MRFSECFHSLGDRNTVNHILYKIQPPSPGGLLNEVDVLKVQRGNYYRKKKNLAVRRALMVLCALLLAGVVCFSGVVLVRHLTAEPAASQGEASPPPSAAESAPPQSAASAAPSQAEAESAAGSSSQGEEPVSSAASQAESAAPAEPGDYSDAAFIGDSRTEALQTYGLLKNATFYTHKGLMVDTAFTKEVIDEGGEKLTVMDAISRHSYQRIYIMLGVNELGWYSTDIFIEDYGKIIDTLKETQPGAAIYVQSILPVSQKKSEIDDIYNNPRINLYNELIQKMCEEKGVTYLPVNTTVMDETGSLPVGASTDGVHPNIDYCRKWVAYLDENT